MEGRDFPLRCSQCNKKVGVLFLAYIGVPHHLSPQICCMACLPTRLVEAEVQGVAKEKIQVIQEWLEEKGERED